MNDKPRIIEAPYVFANHHLRKPAYRHVVTMTLRPVLCHNACGLYYTAATDEEMKPDDVCPDCNAPPKPWRIGEAEEVEYVIHVAFGNIIDWEFLRSKGKITTRIFNAPIARGIVKPPPG